MLILLLKLILTPLLIGSVTLAGRKWGPSVSGWLIGLPLTSGPVSIFLTLEQGTSFAAHSAQGTMMGIISSSAFCLTYGLLSLRIKWPGCWLIGWAVFFIVTAILEQVSLSLVVAFLVVISAHLVALFLMPGFGQSSTSAKIKPPRWDLAGRMIVATSFVLILTGVAGILGPHLSGLLSPLPIYATIATTFTHHLYGAPAARQTLQGVIIGSFAFTTFFLMVAALLVPLGLLACFGLALLAALCVQGCSLWAMRNLPALRLFSS